MKKDTKQIMICVEDEIMKELLSAEVIAVCEKTKVGLTGFVEKTKKMQSLETDPKERSSWDGVIDRCLASRDNIYGLLFLKQNSKVPSELQHDLRRSVGNMLRNRGLEMPPIIEIKM
jgi:hypothetical protein